VFFIITLKVRIILKFDLLFDHILRESSRFILKLGFNNKF